MTFIEFCERLKSDGAYIGDDWHVYRQDGRPLSRMCRNGYYMVRKMYDGENYNFMEHRVIWCFINGSIDENLVINHKDFDRTNNNISNLELITQKENMEHVAVNNRFPDTKGAKHHRAALTEAEAQAVKYMAKHGWRQKDIAVLFNANNTNLISRVVTGARYGNLQEADSIMAIYPTIVCKTSNRNNVKYEDRMSNIGLGLAGEAGEVVDILKKHIYHGHDLDETALLLELGDIMYYLCWLCLEIGLDFSEICFANMEKLNARYPDGFSAERSQNRAKGDV